MQFWEIELRKTNAQKFPNESKCCLEIRSGKVRPLRVLWKYFLNHCVLWTTFRMQNFFGLFPNTEWKVQQSAMNLCLEHITRIRPKVSAECTLREKKSETCVLNKHHFFFVSAEMSVCPFLKCSIANTVLKKGPIQNSKILTSKKSALDIITLFGTF